MARIIKPPNFHKWHNSFIYCIKKFDFFSDDASDSGAQYTYGFSLSPEAKCLGEEYRILTNAIEKRDGKFLSGYFASPGLIEVNIDDDGSPRYCDDLRMDIQTYYRGEKWGVVYNFCIETWKGKDKGYIDEKGSDGFFFLPEYPFLLADALNIFNALSFENTTHLIRLHQMYNRLKKIRDVALSFNESVPKEYSKFFISASLVRAKPINERQKRGLISKINAFRTDYLTPQNDYFEELLEFKRESKMFAYGYKNAFEAYLGKILNNYTYYLEQHRVLKSCGYCGNVFEYAETKQFCSEADGNNCGQTVRNKRFYKKYRDKLQPKARQETKKLREFYAIKNVKK